MQPLTTLTSLLALTTLSQAYFVVSPITARLQNFMYTVEFTVANPVGGIDGPDPMPTYCKLQWPTFLPAPNCYTACPGNAGYFARITSDSSISTADFSLDIAQEFSNLVTIVHQNATVKVSTRNRVAGYKCQGDVCATAPGSQGFKVEGKGGTGELENEILCVPRPDPFA
ncbi:hypothetical protein K470DRAFT_279288 [Piedraia hortae CBS 480.64]|uniref:Uncharacterized protein n=1 Tax=Piedraia hortae CBS 480.64 TaxID=1314780 RepID=A0A6A7BQ92_9PEZI|nr:hypothetical protein K470DRAFT_279288 [Piedraia hortae CBS 480.64]